MNGERIETTTIDVATAKSYLDGGCTCVLYCGEQAFRSEKRGVAPLLEWLKSGRSFMGFSAADKVVGKAAAFLYVLLGVRSVYALVMSEAAEKVLLDHGIEIIYEEKVSAIRNRTNTDFCPMEQAVWGIENPQAAHTAIIQTLEKLKG